MQSTADTQERQKWADDAQRYLVEEAVVIPLYAPKEYLAVNSRVMGEIPKLPINRLWLNGAYIATE